MRAVLVIRARILRDLVEVVLCGESTLDMNNHQGFVILKDNTINVDVSVWFLDGQSL